ncbi:MAG: quinone-interacting membrane-bound oxidoreductase complex subunit QmoC [Elusimicrobia bacterium]|nr:quinone-interacting membrane-bound oxidoreductase complex subunit QmoC [Elusimicrobiota bacterium]
MENMQTISPDLEFIRNIKKAGGQDVKKCYQCATCAAVCSISPAQQPFPRKEMLLAGWGQKDELFKDPDIWLCHQCNDCTIYCPRGAKPGDVLAAVRFNVFENFAFPSFMGRALANPKALPLLILAPMIIIAALIWGATRGDFSFLNEKIVYSKLLPHIWIEAFFIPGSILTALLALAGLLRFWKGLETPSLWTPHPRPLPQGERGFREVLDGAVATVKDLLTHGSLRDCGTNKPRAWAHLLVFFGFIGAAATAGLAVLAMRLFHLDPPIPLAHPIKWLGNASAVLGIAGIFNPGLKAGRHSCSRLHNLLLPHRHRLFSFVLCPLFQVCPHVLPDPGSC